MTPLVSQEWIKNQTDADQHDDIIRDPDYIQSEKSDIEIVVDDQISEQEICILKKAQEDQNGDEEEYIDDEEKSIHQIPEKED